MNSCETCARLGDICPRCELIAESRVEARTIRDVEQPDRWGRTADWHWPRGFGDQTW